MEFFLIPYLWNKERKIKKLPIYLYKKNSSDLIVTKGNWMQKMRKSFTEQFLRKVSVYCIGNFFFVLSP